MNETRHELKTYSELYNDFCSKLQIPNKDEWSNISSQVKENKENVAQQKINKENVAQLARQLKNKDKTLTCPHCQCTNRKFAQMGLEQHIQNPFIKDRLLARIMNNVLCCCLGQQRIVKRLFYIRSIVKLLFMFI